MRKVQMYMNEACERYFVEIKHKAVKVAIHVSRVESVILYYCVCTRNARSILCHMCSSTVLRHYF